MPLKTLSASLENELSTIDDAEFDDGFDTTLTIEQGITGESSQTITPPINMENPAGNYEDMQNYTKISASNTDSVGTYIYI